jgi:NB-ARC domain-containing protein
VVAEPVNLRAGWVHFDFAKAFGRPVKVINDAAMQALGSYRGGKMLFLGLGTGLGSVLIVDGNIMPMELGQLRTKMGPTKVISASRECSTSASRNGATASTRCEWQYAIIRDKPVVPILRLGEYVLPPELRNVHCLDARPSRRWRAALAEIARVLHEPLPSLGEAVGLPSLPPHFRPRPSALSRIAATVLIDLRAPMNLERWQRVTLLNGMGGVGKSVMAGALARSVEARRTFADGIYWVDVRRAPGTETGVEVLAELLTSNDHSGGTAQVGPAEQRLRALLRGKRVSSCSTTWPASSNSSQSSVVLIQRRGSS